MISQDFLPAFCTKRVLILGCGNRLFGDDGFGPAVIDRLRAAYNIPDDIYVMDVGTGIREILFTLCLGDALPREVIVLDALDVNRTQGEIFELPVDALPAEKADDFFMHQAPSANLAKELTTRGVEVKIVGCQSGPVPETVSPGLSDEVQDAVSRVSSSLASRYFSSPH